MKSSDLDIERCVVDGQELFILSSDAWQQALTGTELDGMPLPIPGWIAGWLKEYGDFEAARLAIHHTNSNRWMLVPLVKLNETYYRVHFENVICEHCERRCGPSATPDYAQYPSVVAKAKWEEIMKLPVEKCPHCGGTLNRRHTLWLYRA
jgi:hypothetical protein